MELIVGPNHTSGDPEVDKREDQILAVVKYLPYEELTYKALVQLAHEMQQWNDWPVHVPTNVPDPDPAVRAIDAGLLED